jgi:signal transduction histidine kinase
MLDLASLPRGAFAEALHYNLERFQVLPKVCDHFLSAVAAHLKADAAWLVRTLRENRPVREAYHHGAPRLQDPDLVGRFLRRERPEIPRSLLVAPVQVNGRIEAVVGIERHGADFARGQGWALNRLAAILARDLSRREEERLGRVLDSINRKVVSELRPRDLAYQILDGLHQLLHYDHSAAFLAYDRKRKLLRVEADKIAWTKAKSGFIGHEVPLTEEMERMLLRPDPLFTFDGNEGGSSPGETALFDVLYFHRGDSLPRPKSLLVAPLFYADELLGLLKVAASERLPFDLHDRATTERFLPVAAIALRNARERMTLEKQAVEAEIRAGLVTLARAVAHDLNNAIGSVLPLAEQVREDLLDGSVEPRTLAADMEVVIEKTLLCKRIFGNMMKLGAERGGQGPLDVHSVVREMKPIFDAQVSGRGSIALELASELPVVTFSKPHLERILWNLVANAVESFPAEGGRIAIRSRLDPAHGVILSVADNGAGMEPEVLDRVMEPFFTTKENGNGLGLSICRALAWQSGGQLHLESAAGKGTEAILVLPLAAS